MIVVFLLGRTPLRAEPRLQGTVQPGAVVINEVAWMGTTADYNDEWMELYNTTSHAITLTGWTLQATDGTPNITLSGSIPAHGYFLLERTNDTTVNNIPADQIYTGALENNPNAERLTLYSNTSQVIDTANANGGDWPAGDNGTKSSMERINPLAADTDANWAANDGVTRNGQDANGDPLNGTPQAQNSQYQPPATPTADLSVAKTGPLTTTAGDIITYQLTMSNTGDITATATWLTDTLPAGVTFLNSTPTPSTHAGQQLVWQLGDVPTTALHLITVTAQVSATATGPLVNHITATTTATETVTGN
ncbi:MAG: lamin tail domain-containing protein, partial [Chloroflexota bacterium]|nr:lamin tail domain-containing protein [Chloroflexota bacterium]